MKKCYLVSYFYNPEDQRHSFGMGNLMFVCENQDLDIGEAEKMIQTKNNFPKPPVIITINKITKKQYESREK